MIRPFAYYFNTQHIFTISVDKIRLQPLLTTSTFDQIISAYILFTTSPLNLYALLHTFISKFSQVFSSTSFLSLVQQYSSHFLQAPAHRAGPVCKLILCRVSSVVLANFQASDWSKISSSLRLSWMSSTKKNIVERIYIDDNICCRRKTRKIMKVSTELCHAPTYIELN